MVLEKMGIKSLYLERVNGLIKTDTLTSKVLSEGLKKIVKLEGVDEMEIDRKTGLVTLFPEPGKHIFHVINEYVTQRRLPVETLTLEQGRLDEVFRDITTREVSHG